MSELNNLLEELLQQKDEEDMQLKSQEKYARLAKAIEFFSQRFSLENMTKYMYDFAIDLLDLEDCTFYILEENQYVLYKTMIDHPKSFTFPKEEKHDQLVYFHAGLMDLPHVQSFIGEEVLSYYKPNTGIPIIMDKTLYGFLLFNKGELSKDQIIVAEALMNLFHLAVTNLMFFNRLETAKKSLDTTIFNLFAINQASKALLSELDKTNLVNLSLSVFSELTHSSVTSIFMYDELRDEYVCLGLNDVYGKNKFRPIRIRKSQEDNLYLREVIDFQKDDEIANYQHRFSDDIKVLDYYEPRYIINLVNNDYLLGFITIGERTKDEGYNKSMFELIESLASSTFIAISNAMFLEKMNNNKKSAEIKLNRLKRLNTLVKNMNTANSLENLIELTLETLKISFGYKASFYAKFESDSFQVMRSVGIELDEEEFHLDSIIHKLKEGKTIIRYNADDVASILAEIMTNSFYDMLQGMMMIPVVIDDIEPDLLGIVCLFDVEEGVLSTDENIITLETISNHIAPVVKQLSMLDDIQKKYKVNYKELFLFKLDEVMNESIETDSSLYVVMLKAEVKSLFDEVFDQSFLVSFPNAYSLNENHVAFICHTQSKVQEIISMHKKELTLVIEFPREAKNIDAIKERMTKFVLEL